MHQNQLQRSICVTAVERGFDAPLAESPSFRHADLGQITGGGFVGFGVVILISSLFIDRISYKTVLVIAFLLHILSAVVTVAATSVFDAFGKSATYQCLYWGMFLFAVAYGLCEAVINPLVANLSPGQKTHYLNILHAGWPERVLAYFFAGPGVRVVHLRWEIPITLFLIPTLIYGFVIIKEKFPEILPAVVRDDHP